MMMKRIVPSLFLAAAVAGFALPGFAAPQAPVIVTGQLLDVRNGYVYFTTGNAFKIVMPVHVISLETGQPTTVPPTTGLYARATIDPQSRQVIELAITKTKLPNSAIEPVEQYVVAKSATVAAPELANGEHVTGRPVAVTFNIQVPATTAPSDSVYVSTDASGWDPQAIKADRVDASHYRITRTFASGTKLRIRITRGSWNSVEQGRDGLEPEPHALFIPEVDATSRTYFVYSWSDQTPGQQQVGPDSIPTPFNPNPFGGLPSKDPRTGKPAPVQTPPR